MLRRLSTSCGARFLNKDLVVQELRALALLARQAEPEIQGVVLFGSLAKDNYTPRSDADLLIILKRDSTPFLERIPRFQSLFLTASLPVEVFPYTVEECRSIPLARRALKEGLPL
jgi:predicted nucleotidyltransferase